VGCSNNECQCNSGEWTQFSTFITEILIRVLQSIGRLSKVSSQQRKSKTQEIQALLKAKTMFTEYACSASEMLASPMPWTFCCGVQQSAGRKGRKLAPYRPVKLEPPASPLQVAWSHCMSHFCSARKRVLRQHQQRQSQTGSAVAAYSCCVPTMACNSSTFLSPHLRR